MHIQRKAVAGIPYKGCRGLGCVGRIKIDEIVSSDAEQGHLDVLTRELHALDEVRNGRQVGLVIDGRRRIVSEGHIEAVGTLPIESTEAGLIEKEEHGGGRCRVSLIILECGELGAYEIIEGLFIGALTVASTEFLQGAKKLRHICLDILVQINESTIRIAREDAPSKLNLSRAHLLKECKKHAPATEKGFMIIGYCLGKMAEHLVQKLCLTSDPFEKGFHLYVYLYLRTL